MTCTSRTKKISTKPTTIPQNFDNINQDCAWLSSVPVLCFLINSKFVLILIWCPEKYTQNPGPEKSSRSYVHIFWAAPYC